MNTTSPKPSAKLTNYETFSVSIAVRKAICQTWHHRHCSNPHYKREAYAEIRTLVSALRKLRHA